MRDPAEMVLRAIRWNSADYHQRAKLAHLEESCDLPSQGRPIPGPWARQVAEVFVRLWTDDLVRMGAWPPK